MYYKKQEYFNSKIAEYKEKSENEILDYLSNFWHVSPHADGVIRLYASYQKRDHKDSKGNDFAFFIDVRNEAGDILYYPYNLGKVKIWSQYKASFESQPIWQINVRLSEKKFRKANPFELSLANNIVGKPSLKFNDRLDKESYIKKLFHDTGSTEKDAKTIVNALHNIMDDLYTDADERFVYELIQNADDQPRDGKNVSVNMQLLNRHLLFMHNGRPFDKDDIYSICDIGSSTKRNSKEKIGYKGIGFKSVFTGSDTVIVNSENYSFAFDKYSPIYTGMNIENIPWQLKPIWQEKYRYPQEVRTNEYFWKSPVGISLEIDEGDVKYDNSIRKILSNPLFLLFLKNVDSVHYQHDYNDFVVSKKTEDNIVHITQNDEIISSWATFDFVVDIPSDIREAMQNDRNVPQKMKEATKTQISFAAKIKDSQIEQISNSVLYAYLPTPVNDFQFNFIVNADFLLTANREQLHTKKIWNQFLFQKIGELLIEWSKTLSKNSTSYLSVIPQIELVEEETGHLALSSYFNSAYKSALESEAFILNHKGELAKQDEIIIDKTGLSEIVGADLFCQLLQTEKCLPSQKIDSKILEEDIFEEIELIKFDDVIDVITNNEAFNEWFVSATDEQKKALYKWIDDNDITSRKDDLRTFVANLPLFRFFDTEYSSYRSIVSDRDEITPIITTSHILPIRSVLNRLDFQCSDDLFDENHPLFKYIDLPKEEDLFNSIKDCDFSGLTADDRRTLFISLANFDGVGVAKLKEITLFRNIKGVTKPLSEMVAYRDNAPLWLADYVLCKEDNDADLSDYLISQEDEFENIIQEHIGEIDAPITELYKTYKDEWTGQFTRQIIDNHEIDNKILAIIEESDTKTKEYFLNSIKKLDLLSTSTYKKGSYEYRVLQLALSVYDEPSDFSSKIYFDGQCIKDFSVSDDVVCDFYQNGETKKVRLSLAKLLPQYQNQSDSIDKIKALFETKKDLDKFFETEPKPVYEVHEELNQHLGIPESYFSEWNVDGNVHQFLFATYYRRQKKGWNNLYVPKINLSNETDEFVYELLDFLFDNSISIKESPFTYHLKKYFINKYFDSDFIFEDEQLLPTIEKWANNDKKIKYLKDNGVQTSDCNVIQFRKLFLEDKPINFIDKLSDGDIKSGIEFVATASGFERPFVGENQKNTLLSLKDKCNYLKDKWDDKKMKDNSKEWDSKEYKEWIEDHYPKVFIYPGMLPSQLSYKDEILLNYDDSEYDYYYNKQEKKLFVCNARKIEDILFEVAKDGKSDLDLDDYKELCLEGKVSVSKEDVEKKDRTIKTLEESNRQKDEIIRQYRAKYGELPTNDKNTSNNNNVQDIVINDILTSIHSNSQEEINQQSGKKIERDGLSRNEQASAHREAEKVIKDKLEKDGYDCSNWILDEDNNDPYKKWQSVNQVKNIINPQKETINLVIKSAKGGYIYLSATDFEFLTSNSNNVLMVWDGKNVHSVTAEDIFKKDSNVNLIFDTEYTPKHYYAALSKVFQYIKRTTFAVKNPSYNAYDTIKSFGMDSKTEGVQELFDDNDL